jgi:hypothetical protein
MTTTTIHDQHDTDERTAMTPDTTPVLIERPTVTTTSTSARMLATIAAGLAVVAVVSALSAAGYRAYVAGQAVPPVPAVATVATQTQAELDGADAGPRSRHGVATSSAYTLAVKADDAAGTTHGRIQPLPDAALAGTGAASRTLDDGQPPTQGSAGGGWSARGSQQTVQAGTSDGLPQSRGTLVVS